MALSTQICFAIMVGLPDSIQSIIFRAHKSVVATRIACFRCSFRSPANLNIDFRAEHAVTSSDSREFRIVEFRIVEFRHVEFRIVDLPSYAT